MTQTDEEIYYVMDWKNQYCENGDTIQNNLQIQCNPYQTTNGILQRTRKKNFVHNLYKIQKISNNPNNIEKGRWS